MLFLIFQDGGWDFGPYTPFIISGMVFAIMIVSWIPILKIGLIITHAEAKRGWKWVIVSACIQAGVVFFIMFPYFLTSFTGEMEGGPDIGLIIGLMCLGLFIDLHMINVLHRIGLKRALLVFVLEIIPVVIIMGFALGMGGNGGNGGP